MIHAMKKPTVHTLAAACGLLMAFAAGIGSHEPAAAVAMLAAATVLVGLVLRQAATLAVLLAVATIVLSDPAPVLAAVSGLAALAYLLLRYAAGGAATVTVPTVVAAVGFTFVGLAATAFPLQVSWLPLLAPLAAFGCYALVTHPFVGE